MENEVTLSVVSHGQVKLVEILFKSLEKINFKGKIICTFNCGIEYFENNYQLDISIIENPISLGFGENHNNAFKLCSTKYFGVVNPDIVFESNFFIRLASTLENNGSIGVISTGSKNSIGVLQDNARNFPTIASLINKFFGFNSYIKYSATDGLLEIDWISGQFMFFKYDTFLKIGGFSPKFYMYYEDVDLCKRLRLNGYSVAIDTELSIIHNAQRSSHINPRLFFIHLQSAFKYFFL